MSMNFSPNSVLARTVAVADSGILLPAEMFIVTRARPSRSAIDDTTPMLTPRILMSLPFCNPSPADVKLALSGYTSSYSPKLQRTPTVTAAVTSTSATRPVMMFLVRVVSCMPSPGEAHGVAATPEDQRQHQVQEHDDDDAQTDRPPDRDSHPRRAAARVVAVVAVDQRDRDGEDDRLEETERHVLHRQVQTEVVVVHTRRQAEELRAHELRGEEAGEQRDQVERDDGDHRRGDTRRDEVRLARHRHDLERVDLVGDAHRAQLRGEARADLSGEGHPRDE